MSVSKEKLKRLMPLLEGPGPNSKGWWDMHCPYHNDSKRSAGLNVEEGYFKCQGCGEMKTVEQLLRDEPDWNIVVTGTAGGSQGQAPKEEITGAMLDGWHSSLLSNQKRLNALMTRRALTVEVIMKYEIGWDADQEAYTIPIRGISGDILNVRRYQLDPKEDRRKIWSVAGMGTPTLWPTDQLDHHSIVICEGEWDALLTQQKGIPAITRTGAADVWKPEWSVNFTGKNVYICHDMDTKGQGANKKIAAALRKVAGSITIVKLPYDVDDNHGKDLTDFWMEGRTREDFIDLIRGSSTPIEVEADKDPDRMKKELVPINVIDSFDASLVDHPLRMNVTVTGKRVPSYLIPEVISFDCGISMGPKCEKCPMSTARTPGHMEHTIKAEDGLILHLVNVPDTKMVEVIRKEIGILKCPAFRHTTNSYRTVEEIYVRPSVEDGPSHAEQDFTHRRVISSATHDLTSNQSVILTGTIRPHPTNQANEFQAWKVEKPKTGLDHFEVTPEVLAEMQKFQTDDPMEMLELIAEDVSTHHTRVYGRPDLHIFCDLVFHSLIEVPLDPSDERSKKGWLDAIVIGDTRTGKSEVATGLIHLYQAGDIVSCEAASFAGVVGGLDRIDGSKWIVKWGSVPVHDRRLVALDEVSGLSTQEISSMSNLRSSGLAELTKIQNEKALARTRLLWLGNPRDERMDDVAYGVDALRRLIGNTEDIARFDMAMGAFASDVKVEEINKLRKRPGPPMFSQQAYQGLLKWAWTRKRGDIRWSKGTKELISEMSNDMGKRYIETPALIQGANVRWKLARIAAAIASRTYNTHDGIKLTIDPIHVIAAVEFLDRLYGHPRFGYQSLSKQKLQDLKATMENMENIQIYLASSERLCRFLINSPVFNKTTVQSMMNVTDEAASAILNKLWDIRALEMAGASVRVSPPVLEWIRGRIIG